MGIVKILIIDDDADTCSLLTRFFTKNGYKTECAFSGVSGLAMLEQHTFEVIISDFRLGDLDGNKILERVKEISPRTKVIIITGYSDIRTAVEIIKAGAFNYITKPLLPDEVLMNVQEAVKAYNNPLEEQPVQEFNLNGQNSKLKSTETLNFIEGNSEIANTLYQQIDLVATTNYSIIIYGESGTGKEAAAKRIHEKSPRKNERFVAVDCGVLSKELAASELLGHEKGSFTGAINFKTGSFEYAQNGTLFLDEVSNLSYDIQAMLLRVLQEKKIRKVGGNKDIEVDVRIIVASNENLWEAVKNGKFREDLYHRFNEFTINMPALRERKDDIMLFAHFFLEKACIELNRSIHQFSSGVETVFLKYSWPGNLRELGNVVKRAALLTKGDKIEASSLPQEIIYSDQFNFPGETNMQPTGTDDINLKSAALEAEYQLICDTLRKVNYNKTKAAKVLNVDRKTLYNKMKQYNLVHE